MGTLALIPARNAKMGDSDYLRRKQGIDSSKQVVDDRITLVALDVVQADGRNDAIKAIAATDQVGVVACLGSSLWRSSVRLE